MKKSLKNKIIIGVPVIFIVVMLVVMVIVSVILSKQNRKAANTLIRNTFNIIRYTVSERQEKLLFDSRQMASIDNMGRKIKYVTESRSYFKYDTLRPTYIKIAGVIYSTSITANIWKASIYNSGGDLMAFTVIEESGSTLGCIHNRETIETAFLKPDEELTRQLWTKQTSLPAGIEYNFGRAIPNREAIHFETIDNSLCMVAYTPVIGEEYNSTTEEMEQTQVGLVMTVQRLDTTFVEDISELSGTDVNIFTKGVLLSGTYADYKTFDLGGFADVEDGWTITGQQVAFSEVDIAEGSYFKGVLPVYKNSRRIAAIVILYSKEMARANTTQIIKLLSLVYLVGIIFIVPITILVVVRGIINPITRIASMMREIAYKKDFTKMLKIESQDEIGDLASSFNEMTDNLRRTTTSIDNLNREIAQRKQAEQRQAQLLKELAKVNDELKDFAYVVSHDLKAPLRGIHTLIDWISTDYADKLDKEGKEQIALLSHRAQRMHNLIDGILQYSRVGRVQEEKVQVNLNELVREVIDMIAVPENITITIEGELPVIEFGKTRITQVFQNLLSNAVKYMDKPQGKIEIGCVEEEGFWKLSVADNGPGIEGKHFDKIFQIFQTLSPHNEYESTGIGLTLVKKIIELYGGRIWVDSKVGLGSVFLFTLPKQKLEIKNEKLEANIAS
jgi:signal transduction histidine kinase